MYYDTPVAPICKAQSGTRGGLRPSDIASLETALPALFADALTLSQQPPRADAGGAGASASNSSAVSLHSASTDSTLCEEKSSQILRTPNGHVADAALKCCPDTARLALALHYAAQIRVWMVFADYTRETGLNFIDRAELYRKLGQLGIPCTPHTFNRWLREGHNLFWRVTTYGRVYLIGFEALALALVNMALENGLPDLVSTNRPGTLKPMYIPVSGPLDEFSAHVRAAWLAARNDPQISRWTQERLFNVTAKTLRRWDGLAHLTIERNYTTYTAAHTDAIPLRPDGELRGDVRPYEVKGQGRWLAQLSNRYRTPALRQHPRRGVSARVARITRDVLATFQPPAVSEREGLTALGGLNPTGRYYFADHKRARASEKRSGPHERHVFKGADDGQVCYWEYSPDGRERTDFWECASAGEQRPIAFEYISDSVGNLCTESGESEHPF